MPSVRTEQDEQISEGTITEYRYDTATASLASCL